MDREPIRQAWTTGSVELMTGMEDWRTQHPTATLAELEQALDAQLAAFRAHLLQDLALESAAADWPADPALHPLCPTCAIPLRPRGRRRRRLRTQGGRHIVLHRPYGVCPQCHRGVFPPRP